MADLPGYISDTEIYYDVESAHNLLTGAGHTVTGNDNVIAGADGTVVGDKNALFSIDGSPHTLTGDKTFAVYADEIILNGAVSLGGGGTLDLDDLSDVTITSPASGQVPVYNGAAWVNRALSFTQFWPAAVCDQGGVYAPLWNSNADATAPAYNLEGGTNLTAASLEFVDSGTNQVFQTFRLPSDWTGALDLDIFWKSPATSGNVVWQVQTAGIANGATFDPTWNTAQTVTDAAQGTANRFNTATITGLTTTGLTAGGWLAFRIVRDPTNVSDTLGASAFFLGAELKYRRTLA